MSLSSLPQSIKNKFITSVLDSKRNGFFVEIGSCNPIFTNITYSLERYSGWNGIMVEYEGPYFSSYNYGRPNSTHITQNISDVNFSTIFQDNNAPNNIDYLQIDLEQNNPSTITTIQLLENQVMNNYKFATIIFQQDTYNNTIDNSRTVSREIFDSLGYLRVFTDVTSDNTVFEDWYVYPSLVDNAVVNKITQPQSLSFSDIETILDKL